MYYLVAQKDIRSVAELKGKRVGVSQFGGTSDLSARLALQTLRYRAGEGRDIDSNRR